MLLTSHTLYSPCNGSSSNNNNNIDSAWWIPWEQESHGFRCIALHSQLNSNNWTIRISFYLLIWLWWRLRLRWWNRGTKSQRILPRLRFLWGLFCLGFHEFIECKCCRRNFCYKCFNVTDYTYILSKKILFNYLQSFSEMISSKKLLRERIWFYIKKKILALQQTDKIFFFRRENLAVAATTTATTAFRKSVTFTGFSWLNVLLKLLNSIKCNLVCCVFMGFLLLQMFLDFSTSYFIV